jgi:hypothetical protein
MSCRREFSFGGIPRAAWVIGYGCRFSYVSSMSAGVSALALLCAGRGGGIARWGGGGGLNQEHWEPTVWYVCSFLPCSVSRPVVRSTNSRKSGWRSKSLGGGLLRTALGRCSLVCAPTVLAYSPVVLLGVLRVFVGRFWLLLAPGRLGEIRSELVGALWGACRVVL